MLKSVYKGGSGVILPRPKDEDYFYYYENNDERLEALLSNKTRDTDKHFRIWGSEPKVFLGCYVYPFMEHIVGEKMEGIDTFDICDHKEEYIKLVIKFMGYADISNKKWYQIYIACMMFENGENKLTKEQKEKAQEVHDNGITEQQYKYIMRVLDI